MSKRIKVTRARARKVLSTSRAAPRIDSQLVAEGLDAEVAPTFKWGASPPELQALRRALLARLRSGGGRPRLAGTERRQKIPMADKDWLKLEHVAKSLRTSGLNATAGQLAAHLLHGAIEHLPAGSLQYPSSDRESSYRLSETANPAVTTLRKTQSEASRTTTYLIGAGINQGVPGPERGPLPLARDFFGYVLRQPRFSTDHARKRLQPLWDFVGRYWHRGEVTLRNTDFDIEECFTFIHFQRREAEAASDPERIRLCLQLQLLLTGLIGECFSGVDHWHFFSPAFQKLARRIYEEGAAVVTFNYDTLLEAAMRHASPPDPAARGSLRVRYPDRGIDVTDDAYSPRTWDPLLAYKVHFDELVVKPGLPDPVPGEEFYRPLRTREAEHAPFLKLHGSVDWYSHSGYTLDGRQVAPEHSALGRSRFQRALAHFDFPALDHRYDVEVLAPLIITPTMDKEILAHTIFRHLWQTARDILKRTKELVVIGYSFPATDFHVRRLLREAFAENELDQLCVVNPDASVASLLRDLCHYSKPVVVCRNIGEYLGSHASVKGSAVD